MSLLGKALKSRLPPKGGSSSRNSNCDFSPVSWTNYFDGETYHVLENGTFHVYTKGSKGPALILLHGGGYSALTWALFTQDFCKLLDNCQVLAIDLRGHGLTETSDDNDMDLETMANDVVRVIQAHYGDDKIPNCVVMGHSMGGAVAVAVSYLFVECVAVCVIDVVEGTAMDSLGAMQHILRNRPSSFQSIEQAIQWAYRSGQTHNIQAAKVSMPGQIRNVKTNIVGSQEVYSGRDVASGSTNTVVLPTPSTDVILEDPELESLDEEASNTFVPPMAPPSPSHSSPSHNKPLDYAWRIDLSKTEQFWSGWFRGLSKKFLNAYPPKLLLLANINGLDTALTVGQMQGKFQFVVLPKSGHAIHEDLPSHVAETVLSFLVKQRIVEPPDGFALTLPGC